MQESTGESPRLPSGPFSRKHALEAGHTAAEIRHFLASGDWLVTRRGVYIQRSTSEGCVDNEARQHALQVSAAALSLGTHAAGSHESAALIHQLALVVRPATVCLTRARESGSARSVPKDVRVRISQLLPSHICWRYGIAVTAPARTVVDLGRTLPFREAVVVADAAMRLAGVTRIRLERVLEECQGFPGVRRAREVVAFADPRAESALESLARVLFAKYGLPPPQLQVVLGVTGPIGRVDFLWPDYGVVGEADGLSKYTTRDVLVAENFGKNSCATQDSRSCGSRGTTSYAVPSKP